MSAVPGAPAELGFLVGTWHGLGVGGYPTIEDFRFHQELSIVPMPGGSAAARPVLAHSSRTRRLGPDGRPVGPSAAETGWWRLQPDGAVELLLAHPTGVVEIYLGSGGEDRVELVTDVVARTSTASEVTGARRLYGLVDGELLWAMDLAAVGQPLQPHVSARLQPAASG